MAVRSLSTSAHFLPSVHQAPRSKKIPGLPPLVRRCLYASGDGYRWSQVARGRPGWCCLVFSSGHAGDERCRGGPGGHWAMASPLGDEGALCDCSAPSNRESVYRENVVGGRPQAPSGALQRRNAPLKSPSNDDRMTPS